MPEASTIHTIGYEGRTPDAFLSLLRQRAIDVLVDTRYRTNSRKRGFSRSALSALLREHGIEYVHEVGLGTPPELMKDRRFQGTYDLRVYEAHLEANQEPLQRTAVTTEGRVVALLCFEADPTVCHRSVVAARLARLTGRRVLHL